jgi:hypothetical protein
MAKSFKALWERNFCFGPISAQITPMGYMHTILYVHVLSMDLRHSRCFDLSLQIGHCELTISAPNDQ